MKNLKRFLVIITFCLSIFSCKKDDEKSPSDYTFSKESVSENKAKVEDAGQQMVTEMKAMENVEANQALKVFVDCNSADNPFESSTTKSAPIFRTITAASTLTAGKNALDYLSQMMKADASEDPGSFQEFYDQYKGVYTWDKTNKVWVKAVSAEFKFIFPSVKDGSANDATMVITYTGKTGLHPVEDYDGDLPLTFNASILVKEKKVFEIDFKASYNPEGLPTSVNYFIALYPYKYEITWSYSSSSVSLRYHLTNGSTNIIDFYGKADGNFSKTNITNVSNSDDSEPVDVFSGGNVYFQVFNVKLAGDVDYKGLDAAEQKIENGDLEGFEADSAFAKEINKYVSLDLVLADSKQKIASVVAYPVKKTREYYDYWEEKTVTEEYSTIDMKLIFASDGSPVDLATYFGNGFQDLITDFNSFIVELNNDYDLDLDPVEYDK